MTNRVKGGYLAPLNQSLRADGSRQPWLVAHLKEGKLQSQNSDALWQRNAKEVNPELDTQRHWVGRCSQHLSGSSCHDTNTKLYRLLPFPWTILLTWRRGAWETAGPSHHPAQACAMERTFQLRLTAFDNTGSSSLPVISLSARLPVA